MLRRLDTYLNSITMYKLLLYGLRVLAAISLTFSLVGITSLSFPGLVLSLLLLVTATYSTNKFFSYFWQVQTNTESYILTAMILFFVLPPATTLERGVFIFLAGAIAMTSKFIIAYHGKHIFNPAAYTVALLGLFGLLHSAWWIGSGVLWPFTLMLGLLMVRKLRREYLFAVFAGVSLVFTVLMAIIQHNSVVEALNLLLTGSPLIFLGTIMVTEPSTMPSRKRDQIIFAAFVAVLYAGHWKVGGIFINPELALCLGNIYAFAVSPQYRMRLQLKEVHQISEHVYDFAFTPDRKPVFTPGQYMEWTLPHYKHDSRGNRRTFTIASSPTEDTVHLGVKFYEPSSSYKKALLAMKPGQILFAGQIAGNFILPVDPSEKLVCIAGGIGITPFRSMLKYLVDTGQTRDIVLFYAVSNAAELAYQDVLDKAITHGVQVFPVLGSKEIPDTWDGLTGFIDGTMITQHVPDYKERTFYISGPQIMVEAAKHNLSAIGIRRSRFVTDYFSGY